MTELLTSKELAERLKISQYTVRQWAKRGKIPRITYSDTIHRYDLDAVKAVLGFTAEQQPTTSAT